MINWIKCVTSMDTEGTITHFTTKKKMINKGMSTKLDREIEQDFPNKLSNELLNGKVSYKI